MSLAEEFPPGKKQQGRRSDETGSENKRVVFRPASHALEDHFSLRRHYGISGGSSSGTNSTARHGAPSAPLILRGAAERK